MLRFRQKNWGGAVMAGLFGIIVVSGQEGEERAFEVEPLGFGEGGVAEVRFESEADFYYALLAGDDLGALDETVDVVLGGDGGGVLSDASRGVGVGEGGELRRAFFRVLRRPIDEPGDLDGDGMDDVFELRYGTVLDPLDGSDAEEDADGDGLSNRQEGALRTDPTALTAVVLSVEAEGRAFFAPATVPLKAELVGFGDMATEVVEFYAGERKLGVTGGEPFLFDWQADFPETVELTARVPVEDGGAVRSTPIDVSILVPTPTFTAAADATMASTVSLSGPVPAGTRVRVVGGSVPVVIEPRDEAGELVFDQPLVGNKVNRLYASFEVGDQTSPQQRLEVIQDTQAPKLFVDFPEEGAELTNGEIVIAGRVGDMLSGFMGLDVTVNDEAANVIVGIGQNGTFERAGVPLAMGENEIVVRATDEHGNVTEVVRRVRRVPIEGPMMYVVSGNLQEGEILRMLDAPIVVRVTHANGEPFVNKVVTFEVIRSNGVLINRDALGKPFGVKVQVATDANGLASMQWAMGMDAGCGNNRVAVTSRDIAGTTFFCASALPAPAAQINVGTGNNQRGEAGGPAPELLRAWVSDSCNGIIGVPVTFKVVSGGGTVNGASEATVRTTPTGHASVEFVFGPNAGNVLVEADYPDNPQNPAQFFLVGYAREAEAPTSFRGLVLDNASRPIGGARCTLELADGSARAEVFSAENGAFVIPEIDGAGPAHLYVNGLEATTLRGEPIPRGSFPNLHFEPVVVPNTENTLPLPVLLPELDPANARTYDGTGDVVLTCEGIEGLRMVITAGSMTLPDGTRPSIDEPVVVALNQVHHDDMPMAMPDGAAPPFSWTLQPGGAHFDPPVRIEYPNIKGLAPGTVTYFLSFNHDTHRFEIVATGAVSPDGNTIVTDAGDGLDTAGWGCNCPPYAVTGSCAGDGTGVWAPGQGPGGPSYGENVGPDSDMDGIPDWADCDQVELPLPPLPVPEGKQDHDGDCIINEFDPDFTGGPDEDGDGIDDNKEFEKSLEADLGPEGGLEEGKEHPESPNNRDEGGDPVVLATGEFVMTVTDLKVPGRGFDFDFERTYRSRIRYNGALGHSWDHNYNKRLLVAGGNPAGVDIEYCNGFGRIDTYRWIDGAYVTPDGFYNELWRNGDGTYTIRDRYGFKCFFDVRGVLVRQEDRNGNTMRFEYDGGGRLVRVIDTLGRRIEFAYGANGRIASMTDFMGRRVRYEYDGFGDLRSVRSPAVTGTTTGNDFPEGKETRYVYASPYFRIDWLDYFPVEVDRVVQAVGGAAEDLTIGIPEEGLWDREYVRSKPAIPRDADPDIPQPSELAHNLVSVTDGKGRTYLTNRYGTEEGTYEYDRVTSQTFGQPWQRVRFAYRELNADAVDPGPEVARNETIEIDRNGNRSVYVHNELGNLLEQRVETNRNVVESDPDVFVTRHRYNDDGERTATFLPRGNSMFSHYDEHNADRLQRGNLLRVTHESSTFASSTGTGVSFAVLRKAQRTVSMTYEPVYNQVATVTEERGNDRGYRPPNGGTTSAERYTRRFVFDYQEGDGVAGLAAEMGRTEGEVRALLGANGIELGVGDVNGDGVTDGAAGNRVRLTLPAVQLVAGSTQAAVEGSTTQRSVSTFTYNRFGQLVSETDAEGNVDDYRYHPERDPDGDGVVTAGGGGLAGDTGGYLAESVTDSRTSGRRRGSEAPVAIAQQLFYDAVGNVTRRVDGRGNDTLYEVNALNQVVRERSAAPFRFEKRVFYDANNNVVRREVQNVATNGPGLDGFQTTTYEYDILDNLVAEHREVSGEETLTTRLFYDFNENVVQVTKPEGNVVVTRYDERDLVVEVTRGAGTAEASTTERRYDSNGNLQWVIDAADNDGDGEPERTRFGYDGFDRLAQIEDAVGTVTAYAFDPANHVVGVEVRGSDGGVLGAAGPSLLSKREMLYDEQGRAYQSDESLFANTTAAGGSDGVLTPGDGKVTTRTEYDRSGRVTREVDDNGHERLFAYDGADRRVREVDALGNVMQFSYDANGNRTAVVEVETSPEGLVADETFVTRFEYDALDRIVAEVDHLGSRREFAYDSRDNVVGVRDALGNTTTFTYDGIDRKLSETVDLRAGGSGAGGIDVTNPANGDGRIVTEYRWDRNSRLAALVDDQGNETGYGYDALDRRTVEIFADTRTKTYEFDGDDNVVATTDQIGTVCANLYDGLNRLVERSVTRGAGVVGSTEWRYEYDGLSRRTRAFDNNDPGTVDDDAEVVVHYDSLGRVVAEEQNGAVVRSTFDGVGNRVALQYPNGRVVATGYDPLDRISAISEGATGGAIADFRYLGPGRVLERVYGNGTRLAFHDGAGVQTGYDGLKRRLAMRHENLAGEVIAGSGYAYDREGNRRYERDLVGGTADVYEYDSAYRLTGAALRAPGAAVAGIVNHATTNADAAGIAGSVEQRVFGMDGVGNRTVVETGEGATAYTTNAMNAYVAIDAVVQGHDANGNLTDDGARRFEYDHANRLVRVVGEGVVELGRYTYDGLGRRTGKVTADGEVTYLYDGVHVLEERDGVGVVARQFVYGDQVDAVLQMVSAGGVVSYTHENALGSVVAVSDEGGSISERYRYSPYGETVVLAADGVTALDGSGVGNPYGFTGRRIDEESGLYYYRARSYDPGRGRFLQRDPLGYVDGMGLYEYVGGNPVGWVDPMGLEKSCSKEDFKPGDENVSDVSVGYDDDIVREVDGIGRPIKDFLKGLIPGLPSYKDFAGPTWLTFFMSGLEGVERGAKEERIKRLNKQKSDLRQEVQDNLNRQSQIRKTKDNIRDMNNSVFIEHRDFPKEARDTMNEELNQLEREREELRRRNDDIRERIIPNIDRKKRIENGQLPEG